MQTVGVKVRSIRNDIRRILINTRVRCSETENCPGQWDVLYEYFTRTDSGERLKVGPAIARAKMGIIPLCPVCGERFELDDKATRLLLREAGAYVEKEGVTPRRC